MLQSATFAAMSHPSVAVVILSWNGKHFLEQFLPSVLATTYPNVRIIVADNASTDGTVAYLQGHFPQVEVIALGENHGFAAGYNEALKQVQADYYVLLNQDVAVEPGWIEPVVAAMEQDSIIAMAQPKLRAWDRKGHFEYAGAAGGMMDRFAYTFCRGRIFDTVEADTGQYDAPADIFWASGAAMFVRAELYHRLGGLDSDFFAHMEEIDLCWRAKEAGYRIVYVPESVVYHVGGGSLPQGNPRKTFLNFRNNLAMAWKNWPSSALWWKLPARMVLDGVAGLKALASGDVASVGAIVRAHWNIWLHPSRWWPKRREAQRLIRSNHIGPRNTTGYYSGWVVWAYFAKGKKRWGDIAR